MYQFLLLLNLLNFFMYSTPFLGGHPWRLAWPQKSILLLQFSFHNVFQEVILRWWLDLGILTTCAFFFFLVGRAEKNWCTFVSRTIRAPNILLRSAKYHAWTFLCSNLRNLILNIILASCKVTGYSKTGRTEYLW